MMTLDEISELDRTRDHYNGALSPRTIDRLFETFEQMQMALEAAAALIPEEEELTKERYGDRCDQLREKLFQFERIFSELGERIEYHRIQ